MRKILFLLTFVCIGICANAQDLASLVKDLADKKGDDEKSEKVENKIDYSKLITSDAVTVKGVMIIHKVKTKYYLEIPKNLMGKPMLLASRVSQTSNNKDVIAGQMPSDPQLVEWSSDENKIYLHNALQNVLCDSTESIKPGVEINHIKPVIFAFPIKSINPTTKAVVIDATKFFCSDEKHLSPFIPSTPFDGLFGVSRIKGSYKADLSGILEAKSFPKNINVKSRLSYTVDGKPFTAIVTLSMILLDNEPMRPRIADRRLGYFTDRKIEYSENNDRSEKISFINRWRIEPKPGEMEKWERGEKVEPAKPIIWYIDSAFPEKWRNWLKEGIEDWQMAFEEIGFKNAIVAKDYPKDDPNFDPDDIRYSCLRYSAIQTANAMGPSWTDPRSGEIIQGSVYFYHDVLKLLHNWRFIQTSTVDPKARDYIFEMDVMGPLLRYLIAHEIGHTLGLMHNMRGSYAYPVDSLRSPSFTKEFGTTASIMDYARYNYVAQPGDGVTQFLPPRLGLYDYYIIKWGYCPIPSARTSKEEKATLNKWIAEKQGDPIYQYGEQEILQTVDPASQAESLGDDAVKASKYGIKNLKIIMDSLLIWTSRPGEDYSYTIEMYNEVVRQFSRYMGHVRGYLGGNYLTKNINGDGLKSFTPVSKDKQKEAVTFIVESLRDLPKWTIREEIFSKAHPQNDAIYDYITNQMRSLISGTIIAKISYTAKLASPQEAYSPKEYISDLNKLVWGDNEKELNRVDKLMQYAYIHSIIGTLDLYDNSPNVAKKFAGEEELPCAKIEYKYAPERVLTSSTKEADIKILAREVYYSELVNLRKLLKKRAGKGEKGEHYAYLLYEVERALQK
jgi:hypothetical protein